MRIQTVQVPRISGTHKILVHSRSVNYFLRRLPSVGTHAGYLLSSVLTVPQVYDEYVQAWYKFKESVPRYRYGRSVRATVINMVSVSLREIHMINFFLWDARQAVPTFSQKRP